MPKFLAKTGQNTQKHFRAKAKTIGRNHRWTNRGREGSGARLGLKFSKICLGPPLCFFLKNFEDQKKKRTNPAAPMPGWSYFLAFLPDWLGGRLPPFVHVWFKSISVAR